MTLWQRHTDPAQLEEVVLALPPHLSHLSGTSVVHISDLHVGRYFRADTWAKHIARINALAPDVVVITGDAMDWSRHYTADYIEPLRALAPRVAALAILGNHDFYFGARRLTKLYAEESPVEILRGRRFRTDALPGMVFWGIDDPMTALVKKARYPQLRAWASELDPQAYNILLAHRPDAFGTARRSGFDLQLSGHTHGGQLSFSTPAGTRIHIATPLGPYDRGLFERKVVEHEEHGALDRVVRPRMAQLYVSRGLGFAGVPYRRDCPTEITRFTWRAAAVHAA